MEPRGVERKLTTILCADVAGYSRLMGADEEGTLRALQTCRASIDQLVEQHQGRIFGAAGDSVVAEFPSAVEAVRCALEMQAALQVIGATVPDDRRMCFRIGVNLGDVMVEGSDLKGDGVNVAARLQALSETGGICISGSVFDQVEGKLPIVCEPIGEPRLKNIAKRVRVYRVRSGLPSAGRRIRIRSVRRRILLPVAICGALLLGVAAVGTYFDWHLRAGRNSASVPSVHAFLAVLPFANLSGDQTQEYFSDGITEDIIAALGRFPDLSVVGHEAVRRYKTKAPPPGELNRDLGVRYILEGTVRRDGDRVRVTAQLLDAPNGRHLWSDQYDGELKDLFAVQDEITRSVVGALAIKLIGLETERSFAKPTDNLEAYEYVLRGREYLAAGTDEATSEARSLFERAIRLDPAYASAYAALGWTWLLAAEGGWTEFRVDALQKAEHLAAKAIGLDYGNAEAHALLGRVYLNRGQYAVASNEQARALALNPSDAATYAAQGVLLLFTGHPKEAIDPFETAMRLNPSGSRDKFFKAGAGWAYYLVQRYDDAVRVLERDATNSPDDYYIYAGLAAAYAELGRHADASRSAAAVLKAWPFFEVDTFVVQFAGGENQARIGDGLRKAGLK